MLSETERMWLNGIANWIKDLVVPRNDFPDPVEVYSPQVDESKPGLEVAFSPGEKIPWKGIWFQVEKVEKARITLVPQTVTKRFKK